MNGTTIATGYIIITSPENDENIKFGEIKSIVTTEDKRIFLYIYECETLGYQAHFHSWEIKKTSTKKVVLCNNKITQQVFYPRIATAQTYFITLKFAI